jgi:hypothetical protein
MEQVGRHELLLDGYDAQRDTVILSVLAFHREWVFGKGQGSLTIAADVAL